MKISVILIVFNRSDLLKRSLLSLNYQSHIPDEVIISDDGSDEDILGVLKEISSKLNYKLKYVRQNHLGFRASKVRNNGAREAQNDYLIFMDQDIITSHNFLKTFIEHSNKDRFIVSYPIRLTKEQTDCINENRIEKFDFDSILERRQTFKIKKQFVKDYVSYIQQKIKLSDKGPKLRSSAFAIHRANYVKVNGFDERYKGWGNEDDDLGNRLYAAGIIGYNPFWSEFPIHMYHEPYHDGGQRINKDYYTERKKIISEGSFKCEYGFNNSFDSDEVIITEL